MKVMKENEEDLVLEINFSLEEKDFVVVVRCWSKQLAGS